MFLLSSDKLSRFIDQAFDRGLKPGKIMNKPITKILVRPVFAFGDEAQILAFASNGIYGPEALIPTDILSRARRVSQPRSGLGGHLLSSGTGR